MSHASVLTASFLGIRSVMDVRGTSTRWCTARSVAMLKGAWQCRCDDRPLDAKVGHMNEDGQPSATPNCLPCALWQGVLAHDSFSHGFPRSACELKILDFLRCGSGLVMLPSSVKDLCVYRHSFVVPF